MQEPIEVNDAPRKKWMCAVDNKFFVTTSEAQMCIDSHFDANYRRTPVTKGVNRLMHDGTVWAAMPDYGVYVRFAPGYHGNWTLMSLPMLADNEPDRDGYHDEQMRDVDKNEVDAETPTFWSEALAMLGVE